MATLDFNSVIRTTAGGQTTSTIVTANNIGSYAPALNSTYYIGTTQNVFNRASGAQTLTGVSIDGNAATVTNGVYTTGTQTIGGAKTFSDGITVNTATYNTFTKPSPSTYQTVALFGSTGGGLFLTTDNPIIGVGAYYNTSWIATATSGRQIDFANGNFTFSAFSGATVGGSASWGTVAQLSSAGVFSATGDFRAPIFYDTANTAYYLDPASTSVLYSIAAGVAGNSSANIPALKVTSSGVATTQAAIAIQQQYAEGDTVIFCDYAQYVEWNLMHENASNQLIIHGGASTGNLGSNTFYSPDGTAKTGYIKHVFDMTDGNAYIGGNVGIGKNNPGYKLDVVGSAYASTYMYAGVFYDNDNTAYYANPSAASIFNGLKLVSSGNQVSGDDYSLWILGDSSDWGIGIDKSSANYGITYNLASSHTYAIQGRKNGTEYFRLGTDMLSHDTRLQAPIFYDSNNTVYYIDPASTSNINVLTVNGNTSLQKFTIGNRNLIYSYYHGGAQDLAWKKIADVLLPNSLYSAASFKVNVVDAQGNFGWSTDCKDLTYFISCRRSGGVLNDYDDAILSGPINDYIRIVKTSQGVYELQIRQIQDWQNLYFQFELISGGAGYVTYVSGVPANGSTTGTIYTVNTANANGYTQYYPVVSASASMRSPIFYDSNDTSYYLDAAGTSRLNTTRIGNINVGSGTYLNTITPIGDTNINLSSPSGAFYFDTFPRMPGFYDSANTAYYIDPASTSIVNAFKVYDTLYFGDYTTYISQATPYLKITTPSGYGNFGSANSSWFHMTTDRPNFYMAVGLHVNGDFFVYNTQSQLTSTSVRAPIFYDSGDTTYYLDPANTGTSLLVAGKVGIGITSPLLKLQVDAAPGNPATTGTTQNGIFRISNSTDNAVLDFGMRAAGAGAWLQSTDETSLAANYPLLLNPNGANVGINNLSADTNLQIVGHVHVGNQTTFENAGGWNKTIYLDGAIHARMRIIGSAYASGKNSQTETNIWVDNSVAPYSGLTTNAGSFTINAGFTTLTNSARSPIFYDSDDTNYYCDPNSVSRLSSLRVYSAFDTASSDVYANMRVMRNNATTDGMYIGYGNSGSTSALTRIFGGGATTGELSKYSTYTLEPGSFRSPIFYDSDNTAYYIDPASTSNLNVVNLVGITGAGNAYIQTISTGTSYTSHFQIREASGGGGNTNEIYAPALGFHWSGVVASNILMEASGRIAIRNNPGSGYENFIAAILYAGSSVQAPIFYDSNDTTYYIDPASFSLTSSIGIGGLTSSNNVQMYDSYVDASSSYLQSPPLIIRKDSSATGAIDQAPVGLFIYNLNGTNNTWTKFSMGSREAAGAGNTVSIAGLAAQKTAGTANAWATGNLHFWTKAGATQITNMVAYSSGYVQSDYSFRSPIFYDSNDTNYYIDPASTSRVSTLYVANVLADSASLNGRILLYGNLHIDAYGANDIYCNYYSGRRFRTYKGAGTGVETFRADTDGIVYAFQDFRAPIFYDYNDTTYYVDPASTSIMLYVRAANFYDGTGTYNVNLGSGNSEGRGLVAGYSGGSYGGIGYNVRHTTTGGSWIAPSTDTSTYLLFSNGIYFYYAAGGAAGRTLSYSTIGSLTSAGIFTVSGDVRAPIFYDSNNTAYYIDAASTSVLNTATISTVQTNAIAKQTNGSPITINSGLNAALGLRVYYDMQLYNTLFFTTSGWTEEGRIYGSSSTVTIQAATATTTFVKYAGYSQEGGSFRAPIFYDSDNTAYYIDGASGSKLKYLQIDGDWGASPFGSGSETFTIRSTYASMCQRQTNGNLGYWLHHIPTDGSYMLYGGRGATDGSSWDWSYRAYPNQDGSYVEFRTSARAPIFYDRDNTSYYVDPASTSVLNNLTLTDGNLELYKSQTVDMSNTTTYSTSNYYPVTISVPVDGCVIQIQNNLNSNVPSWATHGSGFTLNLTWRTNGSGWGTTAVRRIISQYNEGFANQVICGGITQMTNSSTEVVWLRGGGQYLFKFSRNLSATAQSTTYTVSSQSVAPTSTAQNTIWNSYSGAWTLYNDATYSTSNMYTPVLYDYNNSAYYVDPASTSNLVGLTVANTITGSISGNAATVTNGAYVNAGQTFTNVNYFLSNKGSTSTVGANNSYALEAFSSDAGAAGMSFHRGGYYAVNMGLDPDNVLRIGGWSASANRWELDMSGNNWVASSFRAPIFYDSNNTSYYIDPASTSVLNALTLGGSLISRLNYLDRAGSAASGLNWYSSGYTSWTEYMASAGATGCGPTANITAPSGTIVTSWALRSFIENIANYGWTWESGTYNGQPSVVAELRSSDGSFRIAGAFTGAGTGLTGTAASLSIGGNAANVTGTVAIANGGTGATTAAAAATNLGLGTGNTPKFLNVFGEKAAVTSSASTTVNTQYNVTELTLSASVTTLTLSNIQASPIVHMWTIVTLGQGTAYSITWPAAVKWPGGTAPTLTSTLNKRDIYQFVTYDGGTTIYAIIVGQNL